MMKKRAWMYRYLVLGTKSTESMLLLNIYITFLHLADAFAQSDTKVHTLSVCVFPGGQTHAKPYTRHMTRVKIQENGNKILLHKKISIHFNKTQNWSQCFIIFLCAYWHKA